MDQYAELNSDDLEIRTIRRIYMVIIAALILSCAPHLIVALAAMITLICGLGAAKRLRKRAPTDSLSADHMRYLLSTFKIAVVLLILTTIIAFLYVMVLHDSAFLQSCLGQITSVLDKEGVRTLLPPCIDEFLEANMVILMTGFAMATAPTFLYLTYRLSKGWRRAAKGYRIAGEGDLL